jgi:hypothetical protein
MHQRYDGLSRSSAAFAVWCSAWYAIGHLAGWHGARSNAIVLSVGFAAASSVSSAFILRKASQLCR